MNDKREKMLLVGAGGFGKVVLEHALLEYDCAFIDDAYKPGEKVCNVPVIGKINEIGNFRNEYPLLVVAIGNNSLREKIYQDAEKFGFTFPNIICRSVYISPYAQIGRGCVFLNNVVIQNGSSVGDGVLLNPGVEIHHGSVVDDFSLIYTNSVIRTNAKVGKKVKIGSNVTISNDVAISDNKEILNGRAIFHSI